MVTTRPKSIRHPVQREQLTLDLGQVPSHAPADFIVNDGNQLAYAHIMAFPDWLGPLTLVRGPAKSGKSHLARVWVERAGAIAATRGDLEALAGKGGQTPVLVEDVDRAGYDEAALFHLFNQSLRDKRCVLMTARAPVGDWPFATPDVLSRARLAAVFDLEGRDDVQLSQMLVKLFADRQITVEPRVVAFMVTRMERSQEEAVALVALADRIALSRGVAVTRAVAAEALEKREAARGVAPRLPFEKTERE